MINDLGKAYDETVIANNEKEAKINVKALNPKVKIVNAKWVYK
tara:strand:- start:465 stop:593 length:129 start_codon:yes stop_codon:yes gene_type:complete